MSRDDIEAPDFEHLIRQLAADAAAALREAAHRAIPEAVEPDFESPGTAATALRDLYPGRGAASAALADFTGRSRRTAQTWLRDTPRGRVAEFLAAVAQMVFTAMAAAAAAKEERLLSEAEEQIEAGGDALAADELREFKYADVGAVDVDYQGIPDPNTRMINQVKVDLNAVADMLPEIEDAEWVFQEQVLNGYGPDLGQTLHIFDWNDGIRLSK